MEKVCGKLVYYYKQDIKSCPVFVVFVVFVSYSYGNMYILYISVLGQSPYTRPRAGIRPCLHYHYHDNLAISE